MKIKQVLVDGTTVYVFTENPEVDIISLKKEYEERDNIEPSIPLGYETPELADYTFLGNKHKCISLWFDNEDVPDFNQFIS
jgi:hypothetical protein